MFKFQKNFEKIEVIYKQQFKKFLNQTNFKKILKFENFFKIKEKLKEKFNKF